MVVATLFIGLALCLALTIPIAISLGIATVAAGFAVSGILGEKMLAMLAQTTITGSDATALLAMPFFMLVGTLMDQSGIAKKLINVAEALVGEATGGLASATIVAAMLFAAISGSGPAVVSALGGILIPAMVNRGYSNEYAAATVASAATIGPVIPPSIPMIVYSVTAGTSVTAMFMGGVVPGILMGIGLICVNVFISKKRNYHGVPRGGGFTWVMKKVKEGILAIIMPVIVLGSIYAGIATPTESAVMGVMYTLIVGCFVFKTLNLKNIKIALIDAAMLSAPVMFLLGGAAVFGRLLTLQHIPEMLATAMLGFSTNKYVIITLIMAFLVVSGCFIDTTSNIVLFAPLFCPIVKALDYSLVYFGVVMTINLCIGFLTPPLGMNLFVAKNISGAPLGGIVRENMAYLIVLIVVMMICVFCPPVVTWLPGLIG